MQLPLTTMSTRSSHIYVRERYMCSYEAQRAHEGHTVVLAAGSRRQRGKMDRRSTELSKVIRNTLEQTVCLELLPRSQIDVYVQVRGWWQAPMFCRVYCVNELALCAA